jgi:pimeloyl-ACP methyl ester carboxylesterase
MSRARRFGLIGAAAGVVAAAAGAAAGVAAERQLIGRRSDQRAQLEAEPFGAMRGEPHVVTATDGVELYVETDDGPAGLTIVFVHGYSLNLDSWHFQRRAMRGLGRLVLYDQRSHGRSGRSPREGVSIDQLGRDLYSVMTEFAPAGPVVLIGHSMGGMSIMSLADQRAELFGEQVIGVGLLSTSAGDLDREAMLLPGLPGRLVRKYATPTLAALARFPAIVERGRKAGTDISYVLTRQYSFGSPVPPSYTEFVNEMISGTPIQVISDFYPIFALHDKYDALDALQKVECVVICGDNDALTPFEHAEAIAERVPNAELVYVERCGHLGFIEHHEIFNEALLAMIDAAVERAAHR